MARYTLKEIDPPAADYIFDVGGIDTRLAAVQKIGIGILHEKGWRSAVIYEGSVPLTEIIDRY